MPAIPRVFLPRTLHTAGTDCATFGNTLTATGDFHRSERPANERIVWEQNILFNSKPGKGTEQGNSIVELALPVVE